MRICSMVALALAVVGWVFAIVMGTVALVWPILLVATVCPLIGAARAALGGEG